MKRVFFRLSTLIAGVLAWVFNYIHTSLLSTSTAGGGLLDIAEDTPGIRGSKWRSRRRKERGSSISLSSFNPPSFSSLPCSFVLLPPPPSPSTLSLLSLSGRRRRCRERDAHRVLEARLRVALAGLRQERRVGRRLADRALACRDLVSGFPVADEREAVGAVVALHEAGVAPLDDDVVLLGVVGEAVDVVLLCCCFGVFFSDDFNFVL